VSPSRLVRHASPALVAAVAAGLAWAGSAGAQDGGTTPPVGTGTTPTTTTPGGGAVTGSPSQTAEGQLQAADPGDLWAAADALATALDRYWNPALGAYVVDGSVRVRLNAEMLLLHSYAAVAGRRSGAAARPDRVEPLTRLLTTDMYLATLDGQLTPAVQEGRTVTAHAPGFTDVNGTASSMHHALDAVAMRALATSWRARDAVRLSAGTRALVQDRVAAVARSPFWRMPSRLLNQVNWNADVYAADATVNGDATLLQQDYAQQLGWFLQHSRSTAYPGGTSNLAQGLGFRYAPHRPASNTANQVDTSEYASIAFGALAYYDQAVAAGMPALSTTDQRRLRNWTRRIAFGDWSNAGILNWDSGKGIQRLQLTQYWALALRGFAAGLAGSAGTPGLANQAGTARALVRQAVRRYQRRAVQAGSVILPAADYGFTGSNLVSDSFDGLTGTARFAAVLAELADRGLASGTGTPLPDATAHDADLGRLAVETERYQAAIVRPWSPLTTGGLEPSRILDAAGRPLTSMGGRGTGSLGLELRRGSSVLVDTQPGKTRKAQSALTVPRASRNASRALSGTLTVTGRDGASDLTVDVAHRISRGSIRTTYTIRNRRSGTVTALLRIPTYGGTSGGSLEVGERPSSSWLRGTRTIVAPSGGRFSLRLKGLPRGARAAVVRAAAQRGNPQPGPQLRVTATVPRGTTRIERLISIPRLSGTDR
jgi:hypothetical protein